MNAKAANKKQTTISAANNWIYPQPVESRDWDSEWETFVGQGQSTTRIPHSHTHISTDRHMYCMPLYESNKPNHVYIYAKITLARRVPVMLRLWLCICICV